MHHSSLTWVLLAIANSPVVKADLATTIVASSNNGVWEGWGTSLAWWAKAFGSRDDLADIFFSLKTSTFNGQTLPGLGLNIARYNAGASSWNSYNGSSMVVSPKMIPSRQVEGYWKDWASTSPSSASWNWSADGNQRNMLWKARDRGATIFELFSNSPMWWMCVNHNPSGSDSGSADNLQSWNYDSHAIYLANIAKYANDNWGFKFQSVEPFNEPVSDWWNGQTGTQEGCHFDVGTQATVIGYLRSELDDRGLSGTMVSASDENTYDLAISTFNSLGSTALGQIGRVNVHGYQYGGGRRDTLYSLVSAAGKKLWNSEYGESDSTGSQLVSNLLLDFRWLKPTAWVYWQVLDGGGWGLIDADNDALTINNANQKYFVVAQFTRHIRPGMRILDAGSDYAVAAYDATNKKLVIVAVNWSSNSAQYINFDLSQFSVPGTNGALVRRWETLIGSSGSQYAAYNDTYLSGSKFWSYFEAGAVQTFEVSGVSI
ncbi:glycoside hydrolase family 30 protein [Diplogelasinospora grovesii]|uniref:Glycoside hydrolase family 30 protein n=1 Tax=Diplogelasinospora grovesii TaxID=303347 RepID=A0AAN6S4B5_9PEZI|nr:glycoside hydrolase family 30 protein [Diplogelasinospora grovesii]